MMRRGIYSRSWPSTTGTITHSELVWQDGESGFGQASEWEAKITYTYMVDGEKLQGNRIKLFLLAGILNTDQNREYYYP